MSRNYKGKRKQRRGPALNNIFMGLGALLVILIVVIVVIAVRGGDKTTSKKDNEKKETNEVTEVTEITEDEETVEEPEYVVITSNGDEQKYDACYRVGDSAFEMYTYSEKSAAAYANVVNTVAKNLNGVSEVYTIAVPLSSGITIPDTLLNTDLFGNQQEAIQNINSQMNDVVNAIDIYDILMQHRNEYVYFRTDHHWTATGAYYAYTKFCEAKGIAANSMTSYRTENFDGYLGSFYYTGTNKCELLKNNPDTVVAYHPLSSEATMDVTTQNGSGFSCGVIYDESQADASLKYGAFIAGDNPYSVITNPAKTDGSACIIVKESFGNAYVPFMVDHYQTIYVIDYRYWNGSISDLAKTKKVQDVLFINNLSALRDSTRMGELTKVM